MVKRGYGTAVCPPLDSIFSVIIAWSIGRKISDMISDSECCTTYSMVKSSFAFENLFSSTLICNKFRFFEPRFTSLLMVTNWRFDWSFAWLIAAPLPSSLASVKPANPGLPGEMAVKTHTQRIILMLRLEWKLVTYDMMHKLFDNGSNVCIVHSRLLCGRITTKWSRIRWTWGR